MRIKLSLLAPFREAKILLAVPDDVQTIAQLKRHLIKGLSAIGSIVQHSKELVLEIEGFELLAGSEIGIILPQDVVCARAAAGSSTPLPSAAPNVIAGVKRKLQSRASTGDLRTSLGKKTKTTPRRAVSTANPVIRPVVAASAPLQSSSDGSSSESESSSETESTSEDESDSSLSSSESSSSSASSSSSSSVSSPEELPSRRKQLAPDTFPPIPLGLLPRPLPTESHVPPGQGKVSTQNRNARRRRARLLKKLGEEASGADTSSVAENGQLEIGQEKPMPLPQGVPTQIANNNKRKGFLKDMVKLRAMKTVFEADETSVAVDARVAMHEKSYKETSYDPAVDISMTSAVSATPGGSKRRPHIVHPSAQTLPSNVFVTSAQFQHPPRYKARGRPAAHARDESFASEDVANGDYAELGDTKGVNAEDEKGEVDEEAAMNEIREVDEWAMWEKAETAFDTLPSLSSVSDERVSQTGALVVWKELELDMTTFSPELRVQLARPKGTANTSEGESPVLRLEKLRRSFEDGEGVEAGETEQSEAEDVVLTGEDLQREPGKWKVLVV